MANTISEISSIIKERLENFRNEAVVSESGKVISVGDGVAIVHGLSNIQAGEILEFEGGVIGLALDLQTDFVGVILLGSDADISEGTMVKGTGKVFNVPVGKELLGRVVDCFGNPLDGKGSIDAKEYRNAEVKAPGIIARKSVHEPVQTGIKSIDALIPVGRGQRELIIGDRQTGKTAIVLDTKL